MGYYRPDPYPVSIKGVAIHNGRALPERNERDEWELPGARSHGG
jgi:hypothetical protein